MITHFRWLKYHYRGDLADFNSIQKLPNDLNGNLSGKGGLTNTQLKSLWLIVNPVWFILDDQNKILAKSQFPTRLRFYLFFSILFLMILICEVKNYQALEKIIFDLCFN